jgi:phosphohistidine swiveling domain-containing protein
MDIVCLGDPACHAPALVGGKAASLSRVAGDYSVPPGFCLTVEFFDRVESERQNFAEARRPVLPPALFQLLANAYAMLATRCGDEHLAVAVRSSAVEEDSPLASFAGAYETYLNVVGVEALAAAVVRCWASAESPRAREYRRSRGLAIEALRVAVLVQQFVPADLSAVVFSADPVSGRDDDVVIEANWGLGESIVAGRATPDTYVVRKQEPAVVSRAVADKRVITIAAAPGTGTRDVTVPRVLRRRPVLDEARATEIAVLARNLEARLGWPVDVECSYRGDDLHLLQCRPLTAFRVVDAQARTALLKETVFVSSATDQPAPCPIVAPPDFPVLWDPPEDAQLFWMMDRMHVPEPVPSLAEPFLRHCFEHGFNLGAKPYSWSFRMRARRINTYWYLTMSPLGVTPHELDAMNERSQEAFNTASFRMEEIWHTEVLPEVQRYLADWAAFDLRAATRTQLTAHLEQTIARSERVWALHFLVCWPMLVAMSAFDDFCHDLFSDGDALEKDRLLQGLDNKSLETDRALWRLSRKVRAAPEIRAAVEQLEPGELMPALERTAEGRQFVADLRDFLEHYGQRAVGILVSDPSWIEDPTPVFIHLREYAAQPDRDLAGEQRERAQERERLVADVRHRLRNYPAALARQFEFYLKAAQAASVLHEDHNIWIDQQAMYQIRRVLLEFGRRFSEAGVIGNADDVFHLTLEELGETARALPALDRRPLVRSRQAEIEHFRSMTPPPALGTMPAGPPPDTPLGRALDQYFGVPVAGPDPQALRGHPASAGTVRGPARVVRSLPEADRVRAGDILVAVATMPAWTPLFATIAAVVTDVGGVTSHCAVVAREYGIPAVVGTNVATSVISDGQLLEVDGQTGTVRILASSS